MVRDIGVAKARTIGGLLPLAQVSQNHSERDCHVLLSKKLDLSLPIPLTAVPSRHDSNPDDETISDCKAIRRISLTDWAEYLLNANHWHVLCGLLRPDAQREQSIWRAFWKKYQCHDPAHPIFKAAADNGLDFGRTAAILLHGDEGRGRRRQAFFVLSWHSVLGRGTNPSLAAGGFTKGSAKRVRKPYLKMALNLKGHAYTTRFVTGVLPKSLYNDDGGPFFDLLAAAYEDAKFLGTVGLKDAKGKRHWLVLLKTIGDWPFLAKAGCLDRTYANSVKTEKQLAAGFFHLCEAGYDHAPLEQIGTRRPNWISTVGSSSPFRSWPEAARIYGRDHEQLAQHFAYDLFHTFHLGVGKNFCGSVIALLSELESGSNVEQRFQQLTEKYRGWCKATGHSTIVSKLTKDLITWEATTDYPKGSWFKGALTTNIMLWIESLDGSVEEPLLLLALDAAKAVNRFFRIVYAEGVWLSVETSSLAGQLLSKFLRRYDQLAAASYADERTLFDYPPKVHLLHHFAVELLQSASAGREGLNPLSYSTQMSEDMVGRPSRLSRRVAPRTVVRRTLERYLLSCYARWVESGLFVESGHKRRQ